MAQQHLLSCQVLTGVSSPQMQKGISHLCCSYCIWEMLHIILAPWEVCCAVLEASWSPDCREPLLVVSLEPFHPCRTHAHSKGLAHHLLEWSSEHVSLTDGFSCMCENNCIFTLTDNQSNSLRQALCSQRGGKVASWPWQEWRAGDLSPARRSPAVLQEGMVVTGGSSRHLTLLTLSFSQEKTQTLVYIKLFKGYKANVFVLGFFSCVCLFFIQLLWKKKEQMKQQVWQVAILKSYLKSFSLRPCQNVSRKKWNDLSDVELDLRISCTLVGDAGK